jgi:hypothetical protein
MRNVDTQEARSALASLNLRLREQAEIADPADIADSAAAIMAEVAEDLKMILGYFRAFDTRGVDELSLRDLVLAGDTILVDFLTPDGPGRLAVSFDDEYPVALTRAPDAARRQWRLLHAA